MFTVLLILISFVVSLGGVIVVVTVCRSILTVVLSVLVVFILVRTTFMS